MCLHVCMRGLCDISHIIYMHSDMHTPWHVQSHTSHTHPIYSEQQHTTGHHPHLEHAGKTPPAAPAPPGGRVRGGGHPQPGSAGTYMYVCCMIHVHTYTYYTLTHPRTNTTQTTTQQAAESDDLRALVSKRIFEPFWQAVTQSPLAAYVDCGGEYRHQARAFCFFVTHLFLCAMRFLSAPIHTLSRTQMPTKHLPQKTVPLLLAGGAPGPFARAGPGHANGQGTSCLYVYICVYVYPRQKPNICVCISIYHHLLTSEQLMYRASPSSSAGSRKWRPRLQLPREIREITRNRRCGASCGRSVPACSFGCSVGMTLNPRENGGWGPLKSCTNTNFFKI